MKYGAMSRTQSQKSNFAMELGLWWISPLVIIIGWFVVDKLSDRREARKEIRARVDGITNLVEQVQEHCYEYYSKAGSDPSIIGVGQSIRCKLKQIGVRIAVVNRGLPGLGLATQFIRFRQAASGKLDESSREAMESGHEIYDNISNTGAVLVALLESAFSRRFGKRSSRI